MNRLLPLLVTVFTLVCGCASLNLSSNLDEKIPPIDEVNRVNTPVTIVILRTFQWLPNGPVESAKFSSSAFGLEIDAIKDLGIFGNPIFVESRAPETETPVMQISLIGTWVTDSCYLGSCLIIPSVSRLSYRLVFSAFDSNGNLKYQDESEIYGEEKRAGLDFSLGSRPVNIVREKGIPLLIKRGLVKFQTSDSFKKLFEIPKNRN